jgi:prepilin-type N-terminal cleavage/methylation domain-containing protein
MQWARQKGFTIVEPLIVIVVIAILAVITIVAYTGIQARTRESSAKSTLSSVAKKIETYNYNTATTA